MTPERYAAVKALFVAVAELPEPERRARLDEEKAKDAELVREVESLLIEHDARTTAQAGAETRQVRLKKRISALAGRLPWRPITAALAALALAGVALWSHERLKTSYMDMVVELLDDALDVHVLRLRSHFASRLAEVQRTADDPAHLALIERLVEIGRTATDVRGELLVAPAHGELVKSTAPSARTLGAFLVMVMSPSFQLVTSSFEPALGRVLTRPTPYSFATPLAFMGKQVVGLPRKLFEGVELGVGLDGLPPIVMYYVTPVARAEQQPIAALIYGFDAIAELGQVFQVDRDRTSVETYAFNDEGTIMSPSRFEADLVKAGLLPEGKTSVTNLALRDPGGDVTAGHRATALERQPFTAGVAAALAERGGKAAVGGKLTSPYRDYRGIEVVAAWRWLPEYKLGVITEMDASEVLAPLRYVRLAGGVIYGLLLVALAALLVASFDSLKARVSGSARIGSYEIVDKLSEGGLGEVYLARHAELRRRAALKVLRRDRVDDESIARFEREVRATARLSHPCTVAVYDFGHCPDGSLYYAMEYVDGITLAKLIELEGRVAPARAVHILRQVCESLAEAHAAALIHRDIKPLNVMVARLGGIYDAVKVVDFGLVKSLASGSDHTKAMARLAGTPLYMAPERLRDHLHADPRIDVYSVGMVAYKMLSGRAPYHSPTEMGLLYEIVNAKPAPLAGFVTGLPRELTDLVMASIEKDPSLRPQTMDELLARLDAVRVGETWTAPQATAWWMAHHELLKAPPWA